MKKIERNGSAARTILDQIEELKNCIMFQGFSLFYHHFMYCDVDSLSLSLLNRHHVQIRYLGSYVKDDTPYSLVMCKVRKKDTERFAAAMRELPNKMYLCGHLEYEAFCEEIMKELAEA